MRPNAGAMRDNTATPTRVAKKALRLWRSSGDIIYPCRLAQAADDGEVVSILGGAITDVARRITTFLQWIAII